MIAPRPPSWLQNTEAAVGNRGEVALAAAQAFFVFRTPLFFLLHVGPDFHSKKMLLLQDKKEGTWYLETHPPAICNKAAQYRSGQEEIPHVQGQEQQLLLSSV